MTGASDSLFSNLRKHGLGNYSRVGIKAVSQPDSEGHSQWFLSTRETGPSEMLRGLSQDKDAEHIIIYMNNGVE